MVVEASLSVLEDGKVGESRAEDSVIKICCTGFDLKEEGKRC